MIHGVMDNFDHEEIMLSGIGGSHDTILMVFQNGNDTLDDATAQINHVPNNLFPKKRLLEHIIDCQKIIRRRKFSGREQSLTTFQPSHHIDHILTIDTSLTHYKTWILACHAGRSQILNFTECASPTIPSYAAMKSLLTNKSYLITRISFTPIIPYTATEFDTMLQ